MKITLIILGVCLLCVIGVIVMIARDDSQSDLPWDEDSES